MIELFQTTDFEYRESDQSLVIWGDCITSMNKMEEKSVDLIFADPPFNLGKDFGNKSDTWTDRKQYLAWCYEWIDSCFLVLKDNGTFYLMN